jgi:HK97 gp10 family phage protein
MANRSFRLEGTEHLLAELRQKVKRATDRVESKALKAGGELLADDMRHRAPVSERATDLHLKDHIRVSNVQRKGGVKYILIGPDKKVSWRAHFPEFGSSKQSATPYIEPAFHAKKREALEVIAEELRKGLGS